MGRGVSLFRPLLGVLFVLLTMARPAGAEELAPTLETGELEERARDEGRRLFSMLEPATQRRLVGLYLAFDPDPTEAIALAACDDDGDYVIVLSEAMLRLTSYVATLGGVFEVEEYARSSARARVVGRRLLPPPPGSFDGAAGSVDELLAETLAFVIGRELAYLRAGDLVCPRPTSTREHGDASWSPSEKREAARVAAALYRGRATVHDVEALSSLRGAERGAKGAVLLLRFFAVLEERGARRPLPSYEAIHPGSRGAETAARALLR